jgi:rod shape-determining protein MreC
MQHHLNFTQSRANHSLKHSFDLVFKKIETVLFSFLCVIFLLASRAGSDFTKSVSFGIVGISAPFAKLVAFPFNTAMSIFTDFGELIDAKRENKILKEELTSLRTFYVKSLDIHQKNKELQNILNYVTSKSTNFKVARIIGRSHQTFNQDIFIDGGTSRQIKEGSIVTGNRGVLGRVVEVGENKSRLMMINDSASRIPVITSKARARGIIAGNNGGLMEILYLSKNHMIEVGDWVFTSGDGDTLPSGLLVGVVKKVTPTYVGVAMVEDVNNADMVTIIDY